jgi:hypothetical protein
MPVSDSNLRALIRFTPVARALKDDVEKAIQLELYEQSGDLIVRSFRNLVAGVQRLVDDSFVASLTEGLDGGDDKQKALGAMLALSQLIAYLEGETGVVSQGGGNDYHYQTAPSYHIGQAYGLNQKELLKATGEDEPEQQ